MSKRTKTISKNFYDDEIKGVYYEDGRKVIYLHEHTHRTYNPYLLDYDRINHRNQQIDFLNKIKELYGKLYGGEDFEDRSEN